MHREDAALADILVDGIAAVGPREVPRQPLGRDVLVDGQGIAAQPRQFQRVLVDIRGEDLHLHRGADFPGPLGQQDGQAVGLLAGGTAGNPKTDRIVLAATVHQAGNDLPGQQGKRLLVAEELGNVDQKIAEQLFCFVIAFSQHVDVLTGLADLQHLHASLDPADQGIFLVAAEIVPRPGLQDSADPDQLIGEIRHRPVATTAIAAGDDVTEIVRQNRWHGLGHQHHIAHRLGAARHAVEFRRFARLHQGQPAGFLDRPQAQGAIAAGPGEDHPGGVLALLLGQRPKKGVERRPVAQRPLRLDQFKQSPFEEQVLAGGIQIDMVGFGGAVGNGLAHLHRGIAGQQPGHHAFMGRIEMLDDDERQTGVFRASAQKGAQRLQSAGRGSQTDDGTSANFFRVRIRPARPFFSAHTQILDN